MTIPAIIALALYALSMGLIAVYSIVQLALSIRWIGSRKRLMHAQVPPAEEWPHVTIQLPLFNERFVARRIIDACSRLDYPHDRMLIQVLDDSTDDTASLASDAVQQLNEAGLRCVFIHRNHRIGFKAGALAHGLELTADRFIAIFDADFIPPPHFLKTALPFLLADSRNGMVQARWTHLNRSTSLLTRLQALALDAHFTVEQGGRNAAGYFINFNGTAGIWRREAIEQAGGWQSDTLTEDLDLSYRAQLAGWKLIYLPFLEVPAELPEDMPAIRSQQFRWTKGAAECARKNSISLLRAANLRILHKFHGIMHLANASLFLCIITAAAASVVMLPLLRENAGLQTAVGIAGGFFLPTIFFAWTFTSAYAGNPRQMGQALLLFPAFLVINLGLSLHQARAVLLGWAGRPSPFIRTPKHAGEIAGNRSYSPRQFPPIATAEALTGFGFFAATAWGLSSGVTALIPFHLMLAIGFTLVSALSLWHARR